MLLGGSEAVWAQGSASRFVVGLFTAGKQSSLHVYTYRVKRQEAEPTRPSRRLRLAIQILGTCIARSGDRVRYEARDAGNSDG